MNNAGMTGALVLIGAGLFANAFMCNTQTVQAVPAPAAVAVQGDVEPTIVWYGTQRWDEKTGSGTSSGTQTTGMLVFRAWSDGTIEYKALRRPSTIFDLSCIADYEVCTTEWRVFSSPTEGLNAAADINFDEVVNGQDLAVLLARWGDAPRNPMPPSDCPLGLLN